MGARARAGERDQRNAQRQSMGQIARPGNSEQFGGLKKGRHERKNIHMTVGVDAERCNRVTDVWELRNRCMGGGQLTPEHVNDFETKGSKYLTNLG